MSENIVDISNPPVPPPKRIMKDGFFTVGETKKSKERTKAWQIYIEEYRKALDESRKIK